MKEGITLVLDADVSRDKETTSQESLARLFGKQLFWKKNPPWINSVFGDYFRI